MVVVVVVVVVVGGGGVVVTAVGNVIVSFNCCVLFVAQEGAATALRIPAARTGPPSGEVPHQLEAAAAVAVPSSYRRGSSGNWAACVAIWPCCRSIRGRRTGAEPQPRDFWALALDSVVAMAVAAADGAGMGVCGNWCLASLGVQPCKHVPSDVCWVPSMSRCRAEQPHRTLGLAPLSCVRGRSPLPANPCLRPGCPLSKKKKEKEKGKRKRKRKPPRKKKGCSDRERTNPDASPSSAQYCSLAEVVHPPLPPLPPTHIHGHRLRYSEFFETLN